jgi:nucleotide-binding universal stress UspA family protein
VQVHELASSMSDHNGRFLRLLVVGVDGSDGARQAVEWSAQLAAATGAAVLAVHVLTFSHELLRDITPDTMRAWRLELQEDLRTHWVEPLAARGVEHRTLMVEHDSAAAGLLASVDDQDADLLVVGARGHGIFADRVLGGVSYRVTHRSRRPVVVVPAELGGV